ncbi:TPA: NAD(P)-binding protein [Legionella pneumophila]|uniref:NAD(P)-binding protein n=2 Tax=Legionella pneumophila TaxID=446 RepID=A0AAN5Q4N4_LEGPN|nr:amine oxidase [Legionella pneumophila]HAT7005564.1 NAD(P)-binding protein [Legionella pneumophila]HAT7744245.1 NAD(P)-binding protein [Legionella pneumophila]HAT7938536.1 NAD(P)-binding protein [Legionella pneumophila]HAT7944264.1 NAD(P)-binding protein [Legionella pneumophila]
MTNKVMNIAIIGGGTGITTAWALENQQKFHVTVFEENDRLGGHIHSIKINNVILEGGAEFIGPPALYPNVHQLFQYLGVALDQFELNMDFDNLKQRDHIVLPPLYHTSSGKSEDTSSILYTLSCGLFGKRRKQNETRVSVDTMLTEMYNLLEMNHLIMDARNKLLHPDNLITLEQFIKEFKEKCVHALSPIDKFAEEFLYPLIASGWGVSIDTIKTFGAHYAMNYLAAGMNWFDAPEGLSSYIDKMVAQCTNTQFNANTAIKKLIPITVDGQIKYQLLKRDNTFVCDAAGSPMIYDDVVISTPAYVTNELLSDIESNTIKVLREKLANVTYYDTTVVFHQDPEYLSPYRTVVHSRFDGTQSANTMCKPWKFNKDEIPIMKTWVLPGQEMPKNVLREVHYKHPVMDKNYYEAQQALHTTQGEAGLWHGGILAGFNDSHESGVTAALQVAAQLNHREHCLNKNERLALFPHILDSVLSPKLSTDIRMEVAGVAAYPSIP